MDLNTKNSEKYTRLASFVTKCKFCRETKLCYSSISKIVEKSEKIYCVIWAFVEDKKEIVYFDHLITFQLLQ